MNTNKPPRPNEPELQSMTRRFRRKAFLIPAFITVVGIFCGFLAIVSAIKGNFRSATQYIFVAIILDGLDGRVARRLNATSAFGREFDSLSDVIAFGVAPAVLLYCWGFHHLAEDFGVLVSFLFVACGATRLARFNVTTGSDPGRYFEGMPIPAAAAAVCSVVYFYPRPLDHPYFVSIVMVYTILLSGLMVSTLPFFSIKHVKLTPRNHRLNLFLLSLVVALAWYQRKLVILLLTIAYALSGPFLYFRFRHQGKLRGQEEREDEIVEETKS